MAVFLLFSWLELKTPPTSSKSLQILEARRCASYECADTAAYHSHFYPIHVLYLFSYNFRLLLISVGMRYAIPFTAFDQVLYEGQNHVGGEGNQPDLFFKCGIKRNGRGWKIHGFHKLTGFLCTMLAVHSTVFPFH